MVTWHTWNGNANMKENLMKQKKVVVAMSGGIDSSVCAFLLKNAGYLPTGVTMKLWSENETVHDQIEAAPDQNATDAQKIAERLNIPHQTIALGNSFRTDVVDRFILDYTKGLTPNPCVECNRCIKFGKLMEFSLKSGFDYLATGHYARIEQEPDGQWQLKKAADATKDQSYFLWSIKKEYLSKILFPLGTYTKQEIRKIAEAQSFENAHRSDSQDICFVPDGDYASFIQKNSKLSFSQGNFVSLDGSILGTHQGLIHYTVGQRKGLGIALGYPAFVARKNAEDNTVSLCSDAELYTDVLTATNVNLLCDLDFTVPQRIEAKIRYRHAPAPATARFLSDRRIEVRFDQPQRAIAPGQSVVFYDGDVVLGGGIIE